METIGAIEEQGMLKILEHLYSILINKRRIKFDDIYKKTGIEKKYWNKLIAGGLIERIGYPSKPVYEWVGMKPNIYMAKETLKDLCDYEDLKDIRTEAKMIENGYYQSEHLMICDDNIINKNVTKKQKYNNIPPTLNEVSERIKQRGITYFTAESFYAYYQSCGWYVGNKKMKDWDASLTYWNTRKSKPIQVQPQQIQMNYTQKSIFDTINEIADWCKRNKRTLFISGNGDVTLKDTENK